jgi:HSP20 family protein
MFATLERYSAVDPLVGAIFGFEGENTFAPALDVTENNDELVVVAEIPGVKKEDVKVSFENGILSIGGERKQSTLSGDARGLVRELRGGRFTRKLRFLNDVNAAAISAELTDGLLRIVLPKAEEAKPKEIDVKVK